VNRFRAAQARLEANARRIAKARDLVHRFGRVVALVEEGLSEVVIAERLGISRGCAFNAARMVKITKLEGRAWLSHEEGRPRAWKRELLARAGLLKK
jgi:hypothetical protein